MTSTTSTPAAPGRLTPSAARRSEWIKTRSLRSSTVLLATTAVFAAVLGPIQTVGHVLSGAPVAAATVEDVTAALALSGMSSAVITAGILGVLLVTNEFTSGQVRTTLVAVPRRTLLVWSKASVTSVVVAVTGVVATAVALVAAVLILRGGGIDADVSIATGIRLVLGATANLVMWAVLGQAFGWLTRSALGAAMALLGLMLVVPALVGIIPGVGPVAAAWLPSQVSLALMRVDAGTGGPGLVAASVATVAYLVASLVLASVVLRRRDAGGGSS